MEFKDDMLYNIIDLPETEQILKFKQHIKVLTDAYNIQESDTVFISCCIGYTRLNAGEGDITTNS